MIAKLLLVIQIILIWILREISQRMPNKEISIEHFKAMGIDARENIPTY